MTGPFLLSISGFIPPCGMVGILSLLRVSCTVKTKFHYTIQLATNSRVGLRPARELVSELVRELLAAGRRPACARRVCVAGQIPLRCPARQLVAGWTA